VGHVQMIFIVNQSNLSLLDLESGKLSKLIVWSIFIGWWIPWNGNYKGRLHMTHYGSLSDIRTIVER